jgi:hypothetical protein
MQGVDCCTAMSKEQKDVVAERLMVALALVKTSCKLRVDGCAVDGKEQKEVEPTSLQ